MAIALLSRCSEGRGLLGNLSAAAGSEGGRVAGEERPPAAQVPKSKGKQNVKQTDDGHGWPASCLRVGLGGGGLVAGTTWAASRSHRRELCPVASCPENHCRKDPPIVPAISISIWQARPQASQARLLALMGSLAPKSGALSGGSSALAQGPWVAKP